MTRPANRKKQPAVHEGKKSHTTLPAWVLKPLSSCLRPVFFVRYYYCRLILVRPNVLVASSSSPEKFQQSVLFTFITEDRPAKILLTAVFQDVKRQFPLFQWKQLLSFV